MNIENNLEDQPIRIIISKGKRITTQQLTDLVGECYGKINSLSDGTFEVLFQSIDGAAVFDRYTLFASIVKNFGCDIKNNEF